MHENSRLLCFLHTTVIRHHAIHDSVGRLPRFTIANFPMPISPTEYVREDLAAQLFRHWCFVIRHCLCLGESPSHFVPINDVEKCRNVIGTAILIIQIVGVFPYVQAEDRST